MPREEFVITPDSGEGARLDIFLAARIPALTRSQIKAVIEAGGVRIGAKPGKSGRRLKAGERIAIVYEITGPEPLAAQDIPLRILYQDSDVIVLDKPAGLVVHPGAGNEAGTLANALLHHFPEIALVGPPDRPGIVHRLDKETSGIMLAARSETGYDSLLGQFKRHDVWKTYLGLVHGRVTAPEGRISWPIGRHATDGKRISTRSRHPKHAETNFRVLRVYDDATLLEIRPVTGRTHQIRVHLSAAGHPIIGDKLYGRKKKAKMAPRLFLHAHSISFLHPATGERLEFASPLPGELEAYLGTLEKTGSPS